jgi:hypothetical protein
MKLNEFLPDLSAQNQSLVKINTAIQNVYDGGFVNFAKGQTGGMMQSNPTPLGIEQLYFDWLRTAYAYRRMFIQDLYLLAYDVTEIRTPLLHLRGEIFRKGLDAWIPKFSVKCKRCGEEYTETKEKCSRCGSKELRKPDPKQVEYFDEIRSNCNIFGQSVEEILQMLEDDINIVDDCFLHLHKQYMHIDGKVWSRVLEVRRIHPALMEFDLSKDGVPRSSHWMCPFHPDDVDVKPGYCEHCGLELSPVMYIYNHRGKRIYLLEDEIIHMSKFSPSETYGYSPLLTIMQKVLTISGMDRFLYRYFFERKTPSGMILTYTDDPQSLEVERARIESKMMEDPTYMPWVGVSQKTGRGRTDFVRLFHTLQEMQYMDVRNEIRDRISAVYGVPQIYLNIFEGVGAMSGQTQQLKVFSNIIDADQRRYNEKLFPQLLKAFHITDWQLKLLPPEEKVESIVLQQAQQRVAIATQMMTLGFQVELKPGTKNIEDLDFIFTGKIQNPMQAMMGGGAGGAAGMMPQLPPGQGGEGSQGGAGAEGGATEAPTAPPRVPTKGVEKAMGIKHYDFNKRSPQEEKTFRDIEAEKIYQGKNLEELAQ